MIEETVIAIIKDVGFPIVICLILLYDRIKQNNGLKKVVENNNTILKKIEQRIK